MGDERLLSKELIAEYQHLPEKMQLGYDGPSATDMLLIMRHVTALTEQLAEARAPVAIWQEQIDRLLELNERLQQERDALAKDAEKWRRVREATSRSASLEVLEPCDACEIRNAVLDAEAQEQ
jgi:hypothetical protein